MTLFPRLEPLEDRIVLDGADPEVTITGPEEGVQLGQQDVGYTLTFDNTGTDSGYVPYVELVIPTSGADGEGDGPSFDSASFLGAPITTTELTFDASGEVEHPFLLNPDGSPFIVTGGQEGDTLVVFELPYGSFSPGNPPVDIDVVIDFSDQADLNAMPTFEALGGFALGCDALDNPDDDPAIRGPADTYVETPELFEVRKFNNGPEEEGATGPSYVYEYNLQIDIAPGQTLDDFVLTDNLPPEIVYLGNVSISGGVNGAVVSEPTVGNQVQPGEQLIVEFDEVSGTVDVRFEYYISNSPSNTTDPTNDPTTGQPAEVNNSVVGEGVWDPADSDDPSITVSDSAMNIIEASAIAIQKSNAEFVDANVDGPSPFDEYEFTLNIQVSDYFTFGDIVVDDFLGDGWDYVDGSAEFFVVEEGSNLGSAASPLSLTGAETVTDDDPVLGQTHLSWDLSQAMVDAGADPLLTGDIAGDGTSSDSQTVVTITYRATILGSYSGTATGDSNISQGDFLTNNATVTADVRDNLSDGGDPTVATGNEVVDTAESDVFIPRGAIESKTVFALNGDTSPPADIVIAAGDTVTFAITYTAPLAAFEDFRIEDNLPQLVFDAAGEFGVATTWIDTPADRTAPPAAGTAYFGANTSPGLLALSPTIATDAPNNGLIFEFGTFTEPVPQEAVFEILFTATVEDAIFAPDLFLTNQATAFETNSFGTEVFTTEIAQFKYGEPDLNITKGVITSDSADPATTLTAAPGLSGVSAGDTSVPRFSGTVNSGVLDGEPLNVDADIQNVDAGDIVTFAIVLENEGASPNGAFNVTIEDTLPAGFAIPSGGLNLSVTDGTGSVISYTRPDGTAATADDIFTTGLMLVDDGPFEGAISVFDETSGENVVVVTYDLEVIDTITPSSTLTNTAGITSYNAFEGNGLPFDPNGPVNRVVTPLEDDATATTQSIDISKTLDSRQFDGDITGRNADEIAVGEEFEFIIRVDVPEGTMFDTVISDVVTNGGMTLLSAEIETFSANFTSSTGLVAGSTVAASGSSWSFDFGDLVNTGDNNASNDFIEIRVFAVADDANVGNANHFMRNEASVSFENADGLTITDSDTADTRIIEPLLELDKRVSPATTEAGGRVSYEVELDNMLGFRDAPAYDLTLSDVLDPELTLDIGSITVLLNGTPVAFDGTNFALTTNVGGDPNAFDVFIDRLDQGDTILIQYEADVSETVAAGLTLPNTADLVYDSTSEDDSGADGDDREYSLSDSEEVVTRAAELDKAFVPGSTSYDDTTGADLGIGELVTYEFTVTIPEGNISDVVLTDTLPAGMEYVSSEVIRIGDDTTGSGAADNIGGSALSVGDAGSNAGQLTTFTFGNLTNLFDATQDTKDEIVVQLTARVTDVPASADGATLTNEGALSYTNGDGGTTTIEDDESMTVVEPDMSIDKTVDPVTADAGDTVSYEIVATNDGDGPAYDMRITDDVVGAEIVAGGAVTITLEDGAGGTYTPVEAPTFTINGAGELEVIVPDLPAGHVVTIAYDAVVQDSVLFSTTYTNTATVAQYDSNPAGDATTPPADPEEERVYTGPSATADVDTPDATLDKTYLSSNNTDTPDAAGADNAQLNVGEEVTYELTITVPQGVADITLTDNLPAGLLAQSATIVSIGDDTNDTSEFLAAGDTDADANITINPARDAVVFNFGEVTIDGADDAAATDTVIVVRVTSIVEDVAAAQEGLSLTNTATLQVTDPGTGAALQAPVTASESVDIVEPDLELEKTGPVGGDPGEVVPYSITVANNGDGPAYDADITDTFADPNLIYQTGTAQVFLNGTLLAPQPTITEPAPAGTDGFQVQDLTLQPGDVIRVDFDVQVSPTAPDAQTFINTATVEYDSADGDPLDVEGNPLGRDDSDSDDHNIATIPRITKTPFTSQFGETDSELGSDPFDLAIGEEVTYRYEITLPEISLDSVVAVDTLPAGMEFVSATVVNVNGTGASGTVTATPDAGNPNEITLDFGAMNNPSDGSIGADDVLVFEVVARVGNDGLAAAGDTLTNTVELDVDPTNGTPFGTQTATADVRVVEPEVEIDKTGPLALSPGGDPGEFTVTVTNVGVAGAEGPAYDLDIADVMPAGLILDPGSFSFADGSGGALTPESFTADATGFLAEFPLLDVGDSIIITYEASLDAGETALSTYENTASADFFSAPDDLLDGVGNPVAEDYTPVEDSHVTSTLPTLEKDASASEHAETPEDNDGDGVQDLAIGETVTYDLVLTLPEIAMDSVVLTDSLPAGLSFVDVEITAIGSEITVDGSTDLATINAGANIATVGQDMTLTLTDVINSYVDGTIAAAEDAITIQITARVDDDPANIGTLPNTQLTNTAGLVVTPQGESALAEVTDTETVEIVEPDLELVKTGDVAVNPGSEVDYTVTITNNGTGPAFDLIVADSFADPNLSLVSGSVMITLDGTDITANVTVVESGTGFTFELDDAVTGDPIPVQAGSTLEVTYSALLDANAPDAQSFVNTATVAYDSLPGDPVDELGDPVDDRDYSTGDDNSVATVPYLTKTPTTSNFSETDSELGSDPFDLSIGEEVTYTYELFLPEIDMDSVVFEDTLPPGMEFVSFNVVSFGSDMTDLSDNALTDPTLSELSDQNFILDFGGIRNNEDTNPPTIGPDDVIILEVVARVTNDGVPEAGDTLTNLATLEVLPVAGNTLNTADATADVRVVEPELEVDKTGPVAVSPGDVGSFEITVENVGPGVVPDATGPAYDVVIADTLPADFALDTGSIAITLNGAAYTPGAGELVATAAGFTLNIDVLLPQDEIVVTYDATLDAGATALDTFTNTVTADYDSAPGDPMDDEGNPVAEVYTPIEADHTVATIPTLDKSAIDTGFAETAENADGDAVTDLQIGETVTYELVMTLPEIGMDTVVLSDSLPTGLTFVSAELTEIGAGITVGGSTDLAAINAGAGFVQGGQDLTVTLNDVVNADTDGTGTRANDAIVVQVVARVDDIAANADDTQLTNTAGLIVDPTGPDGPLTQVVDTETVEIVEPDLELTKTGEVAGDPGQPVDYEITVVNNGTGTAFDVLIADTLASPWLEYQAGSAQVFLNGVLVAPQPTVTAPATAATDGFEVLITEIAPGDEIRVEFSAVIDANAPTAEAFPNTATVDYDSAPGDAVDELGNPVGRTGSDSDNHQIANGPGLVKTAFTSEFSDTDSELVSTPFELSIGEEVTYRYEITLPEIDLESVVLTDLLPTGLEFVSVTVVDVNGTGAAGTVTTTPDGGNPNLITFDFGAMNNASDGSIGADDVLVFDVTARVLSDGSADAGDILTNTATLAVDPVGDDPFVPVEDTAEVTIVEPLLEIEKSGPLAVDPGDFATYTLTIENLGDPAGAGPAFDVNVVDALPPEMLLNPASLSYTIDGGATSPASITSSATGFDATFDVLPAGSVLEITYSARMSPAAVPVSSFENTATVNYDSAPGDPVDEGGDPVGIDYAPIEDDHIISTGPTLTKEAITTEFAETPEDGDGDGVLGLAIGEAVTYELVLTLPEIPMDTVVLTDRLPVGLEFVSASIVDVGSEITINGTQTIGNAGQLMTITLTDVVNAYVDGTIDPTEDTITVEVVARTTDIPMNVEDRQLTNTAGLIVTPEDEGPLDEVVAQDTVEIIEPSISIEKTTTEDDPFLGETFIYTLVITNDANATSPAFNTVVMDNLPFELTLTGNTVLSDPSLGSVAPGSGNGSDTLMVNIPVLEPGETLSIDVEVFVGFRTDVLDPLVNTASIAGGSTPIVDDPNGRTYTDEDTAVILPQPVPEDGGEPDTKAIDGIDDAQFLPILLIDPIFTGTAEPGSNVTLSLYRQDGALDYVRNIVADAGGHWIALFPRVELNGVEDDFHEEFERSVLFDAPVKLLDRPSRDALDYRQEMRELSVGSELLDEAYTLGINVDRPSSLPDGKGLFNTRTFFAPAHIGEIYGNRDVLKVDEIFNNIAFKSVEEMYQSSTDPLGVSLNRFNYEFLAAQTAVPGQQ